MKLFEASIKDDEELKSFFNDQVVSGLYDYKLFRPNSYFDQYKLTTKDYITYILRDSNNKIHATTSLLFKKAYINHKEQTIGYVTDLRVSKSREATLSWPKVFVPAMEEARKNRQCEFVFSDIEQYESKAYNLLLRRRNRATKLPRYHLFQKFYLVVVYGKTFFADNPLLAIKITYGRTEDIEPLCHYLLEKSVRRPLRYHLTPEELERRCREWPNFSVQNFLVARKQNGDIIGCMAPWNNRDVQRVVAHNYHGKSLQVYSTSRLLSPIKLMRPLPHKGDFFSVKHITHSAYDNPDIFYSLLNHAYEDCQNSELLVYPNYLGDYTTRPPLSFITVKIPHGFYTVLDSDKKLPSYLHPNPFYPSPDFQYCYF
jgi:hypothetical protein